MKRIFIAIKISPEIQRKASGWKAEFTALPVRWVPEENLHLTLIPPWAEEDFEAVIGRIEKVSGKIAPFAVGFKRITYGPDPLKPRLIWAEGEALKSLAELRRELAGLIGAKESPRGFKPHLTLARFRPEDYFHFPVKKLDKQISWTEKVDSICLIESILKPGGAEYKVLKTIKL